VVDRSDDASCLLGLEGLAVERVVRTVLGVKIVQLVTDDPDAARCPGCAMVSTSGKDWVLTRPRDLPCGGEFAVVQWRKRRWRCRTQDCPRGSFTEQVGQVPAGMRTTTRLRAALAVAFEDGRDQSEVAAAHGVSWPTVQRAVVALGAVELVEPEPTTVLGMDETRFGRPRWLPDGEQPDGRVRWVRTDPWETGFVDITGDQSLLAGGRPDQRCGPGLARRPHRGVSGPDRGGGDRSARRLCRCRAGGTARRSDRGGVGSDTGAVPGLPWVRFPCPPAEPDVRVSTHPALHVSFPLLSRWWRRGSRGSVCSLRGSGSGSRRRWRRR
jgi:hypothetical protein